MFVRIRLQRGATVERRRRRNRQLALALGALLTPSAVMAFVLGIWRLGADLKWTREFAFSHGVWSHWQVWIATGAILELCAAMLNRYGHSGGEAVS
jgi:hypothetical protein